MRKHRKNEYDVKKAGQRLIWRLSPNEKGETKSFKPNENDFKSLKTILGWITSIKEETMLKQRLFAKLYIKHYTEHMRKHDETILCNEIQESLSVLLSVPLDRFYEAFYRELKVRQFEKIIDNTMRVSGKELTLGELGGIYDEKFVNDTLFHQITEAVNRFGNLD